MQHIRSRTCWRVKKRVYKLYDLPYLVRILMSMTCWTIPCCSTSLFLCIVSRVYTIDTDVVNVKIADLCVVEVDVAKDNTKY